MARTRKLTTKLAELVYSNVWGMVPTTCAIKAAEYLTHFRTGAKNERLVDLSD